MLNKCQKTPLETGMKHFLRSLSIVFIVIAGFAIIDAGRSGIPSVRANYSLVPEFTVYQEEWWTDLMKNLPREKIATPILAVRRDGAMASIVPMPMPVKVSLDHVPMGRLIVRPDLIFAHVYPHLRSKNTMYVRRDDWQMKRHIITGPVDPQCGSPGAAQYLRSEELLGLTARVYRSYTVTGGAEHTSTSWRVPELGCRQIQYIREKMVDGKFRVEFENLAVRFERKADPALFEIPESYIEEKPSESIVRHGYHTGRPLTAAELQGIQKEDVTYLNRRTRQAE